ncbi:DNA polymerase III subunit delta [Mycoplasma sp. 1331]|uniref:DNA-directed DNA polymerase n=1 Tax=Mycoplasma tauri TaxID=547987 RepID=A0A953T4T3_9MOLU|nr:DNA polymerase III subunit delta [Mycoplasma tauri]MBZ4195315.1 DNA polymerase III subunit delta [Mycoplasma tauri]
MIFIYGDEEFLIENEIEKIKNKNGDKNFEIFRFSDGASIDEFTHTISSSDIFNRARLFLVYDFPFFELKKLSKEDEFYSYEIIKALKIQSNDTYVFINKEISDKNKISANSFTKFIFEDKGHSTKMIEAKSISKKDIFVIIKSLASKYKVNMDDNAINALIDKTPNDLLIIEQEIKKLSMQGKIIDSEIIFESVSEYYNNEDQFGFVNSLESNDLALIWTKYNEKMIEGAEISLLIGQISQVFILAHQIYAYKITNEGLDKLAKELNINNYRIKKISSFLNKIGIIKIKKMIKSLSSLDQEIKNGKVNDKIGFERFLIKYFK